MLDSVRTFADVSIFGGLGFFTFLFLISLEGSAPNLAKVGRFESGTPGYVCYRIAGSSYLSPPRRSQKRRIPR